MTGEVVLEIPGVADYVRLVRMVVSSLVVARRELDDQAVDDLALAVSEACTLLLEDDPTGRSITVTCREDDVAFVVEVDDGTTHQLAAAGESVRLPDPRVWDGDSSVGFQLIRALVDEAEVVHHDGHDALRLSMRCLPTRA